MDISHFFTHSLFSGNLCYLYFGALVNTIVSIKVLYRHRFYFSWVYGPIVKMLGLKVTDSTFNIWGNCQTIFSRIYAVFHVTCRKHSSLYFFFRLIYLPVSVLWLYVYTCTICIPAAHRCQKGSQILWNWSYRCLLSAVCLLGIEPRYLIKTSSVLNSY